MINSSGRVTVVYFPENIIDCLNGTTALLALANDDGAESKTIIISG
jgi:hypothetical protein